MNFLIAIDPRSFFTLKNHSVINPVFSHDLNCLQFAHELLEHGFKCKIAPNQKSESITYEVSQVYPILQFTVNEESFYPDFVIFSGVENSYLKSEYPKARGIALQSALNIVEESSTVTAGWPAQMIYGLRNHVDLVITQNNRMKELAFSLFAILAGWKDKEKIIVSPQGITRSLIDTYSNADLIRAEKRRQFKVSPSDYLIINAGGIWKWTDFNSFLRIFLSEAESANFNLHLIQPGLSQQSNNDHKDYLEETKTIINGASGKARSHVHVIRDWITDRQELDHLLLACDIGLNLNPDSLENWQSHRVRILEYIAAGIPVLSTKGDPYQDSPVQNAFLFVDERTPQGYQKALRQIPDFVAQYSKDQRIANLTLMRSSNNFGKIIEKIFSEDFLFTSPKLERESLEEALNRISSSYSQSSSFDSLRKFLVRHKFVDRFLTKLRVRKFLVHTLRSLERFFKI
jgi:glycosyltransferase involved in cell wall biosynthesis